MAGTHSRYDRAHTLFYTDPPYWQTEGYGVGFGVEQYEEVAGVLGKNLKSKAIISADKMWTLEEKQVKPSEGEKY
ncbi:hypothetical protein V6R97_06935 [Chromohalobacter salexigens]|uniref:hypothetical protein n=1 Tax=Chromohalobacter israelensis TaxID=141390 RepID=UPI0032E935C0